MIGVGGGWCRWLWRDGGWCGWVLSVWVRVGGFGAGCVGVVWGGGGDAMFVDFGNYFSRGHQNPRKSITIKPNASSSIAIRLG